MVFHRQSVPVGLFSIVAFVVAFAIATDALATRTRTGGISGGGSFADLSIRLFDENATIEFVPGRTDFFNVTSETATADTFIPCKFTASSDPDAPLDDKLCKTSLSCAAFKVGTCGAKGKAGTFGFRTNIGTCGTGGCTGSITVFNLDGTPYPDPNGPPYTLAINADTTGFSKTVCSDSYPLSGVYKRGEWGRLVTICEAGKANFSPDEPVVSQDVRGATGSDFESHTTWFDAHRVLCKSENFSQLSCQNSGIVWIDASPTFLGPVDQASCQAAANTLKCGQTIDPLTNDPVFGPTVAASGGVCSLNSQGGCECKCPKCDTAVEPAVPLYTAFPTIPGTAQYAITREAVKGLDDQGSAAACIVTLTGGGGS